MRAFLDHPRVGRLAAIAIGVVFVVAALAKIGDLETFAKQVHNFRLVPVAVENLVAMTLPWIELIAGIAAILALKRRAAASLLLVLMVVFTVAVAQAWARGLDIECGCFGKASATTVGASKALENLGLTLLAWIATRGREGSGAA